MVTSVKTLGTFDDTVVQCTCTFELAACTEGKGRQFSLLGPISSKEPVLASEVVGRVLNDSGHHMSVRKGEGGSREGYT